VLTDVCGLDPDGELAAMVRSRYHRLLAEEMSGNGQAYFG
jgi:hypothetical protein